MGKRKALWWLTGVVVLLVAVTFGLRAGCVDVSATVTPSAVEEGLANFVVDHSVARRAPKGPNPVAVTPEVLARGLAEYREHCLLCHGAPGLKPSGIARGLNPDPPDLAAPDSQEPSDGELFQVISAGIRMSGMPAFSKSESPETLWKLVAFVRHLPKLTDAEREALAERRGGNPPGQPDAGPTSL
jgi:mono/diheme cytochrome c family protein